MPEAPIPAQSMLGLLDFLVLYRIFVNVLGNVLATAERPTLSFPSPLTWLFSLTPHPLLLLFFLQLSLLTILSCDFSVSAHFFATWQQLLK